MKSLLISLYTVGLLSIGFYARGVCEIKHQETELVQLAKADQQDAFSKLAARLNRGAR